MFGLDPSQIVVNPLPVAPRAGEPYRNVRDARGTEIKHAGRRARPKIKFLRDVAGLMVFVISFAYMLVPSILMCLGAGGLVGMMHFGDVGWGIAGGGLTLLTFLIIIALAFILPMALAHFVAEDRIGAAFEFGEVWRRIRTVFGDYLVAIVLFMVLSVILGTLFVIPILGWIVFLFGVFYLGVAFANLIGRLYHQASAGNSTIGVIR